MLEGARVSEWSLQGSTGRSYASISGDFNPIHLHASLSRLFGFRSAIVQGMYSVGRLAIEVESVHGVSIRSIQAKFARPIRIPGKVHVSTSQAQSYVLSQDDRPCVELELAFS